MGRICFQNDNETLLMTFLMTFSLTKFKLQNYELKGNDCIPKNVFPEHSTT